MLGEKNGVLPVVRTANCIGLASPSYQNPSDFQPFFCRLEGESEREGATRDQMSDTNRIQFRFLQSARMKSKWQQRMLKETQTMDLYSLICKVILFTQFESRRVFLWGKDP